MSGREFVAFSAGAVAAAAFVNVTRGEWGLVALCAVVTVLDLAWLALTPRGGAS